MDRLRWFAPSSLVLLTGIGALHCSASEGGAPPTQVAYDASDGNQDVALDSVSEKPKDSANEWIVIVPEAGDVQDAATGDGEAGLSGCGDGKIEPGEVCDDANSESGDGCSSDCKVIEKDFACPQPGSACVSTVKCGDAIISGAETCDDMNVKLGDGCSVDCKLEAGWACPVVGKPCVPAACGDAIVVGNEECDDGNPAPGDGCSDGCKLEPGWACDVAGQPCHATVCNDGIKEGSEPCDDGNQVVGDGCNPFCEVEPNCGAGPCKSACGDGLILPGDNEACDDGNTKDGDGCSAACLLEAGFKCDNVSGVLPPVLEVPITFRDFVAFPLGAIPKHPDFETFTGVTETVGMVGALLDVDGKPSYTGICEINNVIGPCPFGAETTSKDDFDQWYRDVPAVNMTMVTKLSLAKQPDASYYFPDSAFFPWDSKGWVGAGQENTFNGHNFGFTSELKYWFEYKGGEQLVFSGDDDVWVFINGRLAVDIGGLHPPVTKGITLDAAAAQLLSLELGKIYETSLFQAERHTDGSNFNLTLTGFASAKSSCLAICGDGMVVGDEVCDDGVNNGQYGSCTPDCKGRGPFCGDAQQQKPPEDCDDGVNLTTYGQGGKPGCAPGCKWSAYCGDGKLDSLFAEECDDGTNPGGYGKCKPDCRLDGRCGDNIVQSEAGETCDDGNTVSGDGCSATCKKEGPK